MILEGCPLRRLVFSFLCPRFYVELLCQVFALLLCHLHITAWAHQRSIKPGMLVLSMDGSSSSQINCSLNYCTRPSQHCMST